MEPVRLLVCIAPDHRHVLNGHQISDFLIQLFPSIPRDRFATLSCSHVIPKNNLLTQVVSMGPKKMEFEFKFANRGDDALVGTSSDGSGRST